MNCSGTPQPRRKISGIVPSEIRRVSMPMLHGAWCSHVSNPNVLARLVLANVVHANLALPKFASVSFESVRFADSRIAPLRFAFSNSASATQTATCSISIESIGVNPATVYCKSVVVEG